ncbi:MAG: ATP-binding cassette domain-containing protein [Gammaproteobacteria bacterium]|nr:ATP-binding cassette domain-containing protein [Gammaproteobacteria bacterium]MCP5139479.1 ATP-binding cassette domain-containing protein [Chromatiales bacterium]
MPLLEVENLRVHLPVRQSHLFRSGTASLRAVDGISFRLDAGETLGIVGESGCGKSTLCRAIMQLIAPSSGKVLWSGENLPDLARQEMDRKRSELQMVFQDPTASLNPRMTIGSAIGEPLRVFRPDLDQESRHRAVQEMMQAVGLPPELANRYPHQFSGGQCQRVAIARAMILKPRLVVCDEPVSALDVSTQAQIVNLLKHLQKNSGAAFIFVSHDLPAVRYMCTRIMVMYLGKVVEIGTRDELFGNPRHPYTKALLGAVRHSRHAGREEARVVLSGEVPSAMDPPSGCAFHTRCPRASQWCRKEAPLLDDVTASHQVACHYWNDLPEKESVTEARLA